MAIIDGNTLQQIKSLSEMDEGIRPITLVPGQIVEVGAPFI
jgi:hypothetical protein